MLIQEAVMAFDIMAFDMTRLVDNHFGATSDTNQVDFLLGTLDPLFQHCLLHYSTLANFSLL